MGLMMELSGALHLLRIHTANVERMGDIFVVFVAILKREKEISEVCD